MKPSLTKLFIVLFMCGSITATGQLSLAPATSATQLAQRMVGEGVTISNISFTGRLDMTALFNNSGGNNINIDSGIVLTSGRARTVPGAIGVDNLQSQNADFPWNYPGDAALSALIGEVTRDACVLQFDFVPLGDSIKFNYVFSSEEYPEFACGQFNDAFAFFISGPGIAGQKNIALIPNTNLPVTIDNINNAACGLFPQYYVDNTGNGVFSHDGHTTLFTAKERVQPCETYTLKLVIADAVDDQYDSGVFLQARSLSSNAIGMDNQTQVDPTTGLSYLVEGCVTGAFNVTRPRKDPFPLIVNFSFGGTAINGTDYQPMPASVIIPANDSVVTVNVVPLIDGIPEGIEEIKIYALAGCASASIPTDSTIIQIRDYDILSLSPDTALICKNGSVQLTASTGYTTYQWMTDPTLSADNIRDPVATPGNPATMYICTATIGTCNARDSVFVQWKDLEFISKTDVNCRNGQTGQIKVTGGPEWEAPREFSLDGINWQTDSTFNNLGTGTYWVKMRDGVCVDSVQVDIVQAFPDLVVNTTNTRTATCTGGADGEITVAASGGNGVFEYSTDGINFQPGNLFYVTAGTYTVTVKDGNGCLSTQTVAVLLDNSVTADAGTDHTICEGTSYTLPAISNALSYAWTPAASLDNPAALSPLATPATTTKYYLTATSGICSRVDSITITVRPAPLADAGADIAVCYGKTFQLHGSGGVSYEWSQSTYFVSASNVKDPDVKATNDIRYSLMVTDANGCRSILADEVIVDVTPAVRIFAGNDTIAAMNQPIQLNVREMGNAGVTTYTWTPASNLSDATIANPVATLTSDQRYLVTGATPEGCLGMDDVLVKVYKGPDIYVPTGFTPNNDGLNDWLRPVPVGIKDFKYFRVYNRWGQLVFFTQDPQRGWDGKINGMEQPTGTFVWMAEAIDYKGNLVSRKGVVTIIR